MPSQRKSRFRRSGSGRRAADRASRGKRRSWLPRRPLLALALVLLLVWLVACLVVIVEPTVDRPGKVDAILVLGPPDVDGRDDAAYALAREHYAGTVVISVQSDLQQRLKGACRNQNPDYQVICFQPRPGTTQGEAREIAALAKQHGWKSIMVVTSKYHVSRARLIIDRCMTGKVLVIAAPGRPSVAKWAYEFLYQTGGYLKAFAHRGC